MGSPTRRRPRVNPARKAKVMRLGGATVLWLTAGRDTTAYRVEALSCDPGQVGFKLTKADRGDGPGEVYEVLLYGPRSRCQCRAFVHRGACKHVAGLQAVLDAGQLRPPSAPQLDPIDRDALAAGEAAALDPPVPDPAGPDEEGDRVR